MSRRYLVVDDNLQFADNLGEILRGQGAEVDVAHDANEALAFLGAAQFDAVVTDMKMPGMGGAELVPWLRSIDADLPIIVLSAFAQESDLEKARACGLLAVLPKPADVPRLLRLLEQARRVTVLVVDHDRALTDAVAGALAPRGVTVVQASRLEEVARLSCKPTLALVEFAMPGTVAGSALQQVRQRFPGVKTISLEGASPFSGERSSSPDALRKPLDLAALAARAEALFGSA